MLEIYVFLALSQNQMIFRVNCHSIETTKSDYLMLIDIIIDTYYMKACALYLIINTKSENMIPRYTL